MAVAITDSPSLSAAFHLVVLPLPRQDGWGGFIAQPCWKHRKELFGVVPHPSVP